MQSHGPRYLRIAALGDSSTFGLGDPVPGGYRGWSRLLVEALVRSGYDVSFCNLAVPGATAGSVLADQLDEAVAHRPDLASLVVGVNDVLKSTWDPGRVRHELVTCAETLTGQGATLLTARFHEHERVLPLPEPLRRPLRNRMDQLNSVWDDIFATYGGLRVDLQSVPEALDRRFWAVDRMHPSELGHRCLARAFAGELATLGIEVEPPSPACEGGLPATWQRDVLWLLAEGAPWIGRRARDLGPWAARRAWGEIRPVAKPVRTG